MDAFNLPEEIRTFIFEEYLPEVISHTYDIIKCNFQIRLATADLHLDQVDKTTLQTNTMGTLVKLIYAFLWQVCDHPPPPLPPPRQEYFLTDADIFLDPQVNEWGYTYMATVNNVRMPHQARLGCY